MSKRQEIPRESTVHDAALPSLTALSFTQPACSEWNGQTDGHRAVYQCRRGDVAFGAGDYAVSRAVSLGLCGKHKVPH